MRLFNWLSGRLSNRHRALWRYKRGMIKAKLRDHKSAIADYTAAIEMDDAPADVRAMALYNRALVHHACGNEAAAIGDLERLLDTAGARENVRTEARRQLLRMQRSADRDTQRQTND